MNTAAGCVIQKAAGDVGQSHFTAVFIFKLVEATFPATVAQGFPLNGVHFLKRLVFPEFRGQFGHNAPKISRASALSASICLIRVSSPSKFSSPRKKATNATED